MLQSLLKYASSATADVQSVIKIGLSPVWVMGLFKKKK